MNLPLCTPDKIDCVRNIETEYKECLPHCSGLWVISYNQEKGLKGREQSLSQQNDPKFCICGGQMRSSFRKTIFVKLQVCLKVNLAARKL